ncbi:hypothetical protein BHE74_00019146 [Ensete ventricosum]|nr:hypothetical protein BHE74_00019146 [Ensete ventricosum]
MVMTCASLAVRSSRPEPPEAKLTPVVVSERSRRIGAEQGVKVVVVAGIQGRVAEREDRRDVEAARGSERVWRGKTLHGLV